MPSFLPETIVHMPGAGPLPATGPRLDLIGRDARRAPRRLVNQLESGTSSSVLTFVRTNVPALAGVEKRVLEEIVGPVDVPWPHPGGVLRLGILQQRIVRERTRCAAPAIRAADAATTASAGETGARRRRVIAGTSEAAAGPPNATYTRVPSPLPNADFRAHEDGLGRC